jgi:hypothetical protein
MMRQAILVGMEVLEVRLVNYRLPQIIRKERVMSAAVQQPEVHQEMRAVGEIWAAARAAAVKMLLVLE